MQTVDKDSGTSILTATHWGIVRAEVKNGRLVSLAPFERDEAPSSNLDLLAALPYADARIQHPMVREGFLKSGALSREHRGEDRFFQVSWEEALDLAAREIRRVYREHGPSAVFGRSYGWMSPGKVNSAVTLARRLLNLCGGFVPCVNSYSTAAISTILPYVVGQSDPRTTAWDVVLAESERIVFWGANPLFTNDVDWLTTLHQGTGNLKKLKDKVEAGCIKTYSVNPIQTDTGVFLDSRWIAPRPGTDCALMLGTIHELVATGEADFAFLKRCTSGYERFLDYVSGRTDGITKTPEWAETKTGVSAATIREFAHDLAQHRTMIMMGWGPQRAQFGEQVPWMGFALAAVLGQIGLPGGGIGTNYHYSSGGCPNAMGPLLGGISAKVPAVWRTASTPCVSPIPVARFVDCFLHPGKTIDFNGRRVTYPDVKLVLWAGGNPFAHQPDTNKLLRAWKKPEAVTVVDSVWTATARHADIVLPAATLFERNDITNIGSYTNDGIVAMHQVIEPQGEAKSDYWIFSELAKRLGIEPQFTEGLDEMGWIRQLYDDARRSGDRMGISLPDFEAFWKKGVVLFDRDEAAQRFIAFEKFRHDPDSHPLGTDSGLIELFSPRIESYGYADCPPHPAFIEPVEGVNTRTIEAPLALVAPKSRIRLHSQLDGALWEEGEASASDHEPCWIHPTDARSRGISTGDVVLVRNQRGAILAQAFVTERVMPGVVVVHHGAWYSPKELGAVEGFDGMRVDLRGNSNTLTLDEPTSSLACGNIASTALVAVSKWTTDRPSETVRTSLL